MTLKEFIEKEGSQEKAARKIGVAFTTLHNWLHSSEHPGELAQYRLKSLGITIPEKK